MYLYTLDCDGKRMLRLLTRNRLDFCIISRSERLSDIFAYVDCLTVDEMEKFMVYDSGADCRKLIYFYFFLFFLLCIIMLQLSSLNAVHPLLAFLPF